ncbi:MAG: glycosyltransferase family 2 protein [Candidatus Diapherotrites archaeon]
MISFSVIIPAFNAEKTIARTLDSVLAQKGKDFEVIVVDDASTDGTRRILEGYKKKIKIVRNERNKGRSYTRNSGARKARGKTIVFLDSDVTAEKGWLKKLVEPFEEEKELFAVSGEVCGTSDGSISSDFFCFAIGASKFQGYNVAFDRKKFLEMKGFNEKLRNFEDPELTWRAFNKGLKLKKVEAKAFHQAYHFTERIKSNFYYVFYDAAVIKKYFYSVIENLSSFVFNAPNNLRQTVGFYVLFIASLLLAVLSLIATENIFSLLFFFLPSLFGEVRIISLRKRVQYKNNFALIMFYAFFALLAFSLVKGFVFLYALIYSPKI